jgi:hypothetical protein
MSDDPHRWVYEWAKTADGLVRNPNGRELSAVVRNGFSTEKPRFATPPPFTPPPLRDKQGRALPQPRRR